MKPLLDGAMELPLDKYRIRIDELEGKLASEKERADKMSVEAERLRKELEELKKINNHFEILLMKNEQENEEIS